MSKKKDDEKKEDADEKKCAFKKRTRTIMTPIQNSLLMKFFLIDPFPTTEIRKDLARCLDIKPRTVQIWFQNQRQKAKNKGDRSGLLNMWPEYLNFAISNNTESKSSLEILADVAYSEYCKTNSDKKH